MTRTNFIKAIYRGLSNAVLDEADVDKLVYVGTNANRVGTNFDRGPGCPLVQAGIAHKSGTLADDSTPIMDTEYWLFVRGYDRAIRDFAPDERGRGVIEIED